MFSRFSYKLLATMVACFSLMLPAWAQMSFKYVSIDFPNATATRAAGINSGGTIVGTYSKIEPGVPDPSPDHSDRGFRIKDGSFSTINVSGALGTQLTGINGNGDIVGLYNSSDDRTHGFWRHNGVIRSLSFGALAINNTPTIVGIVSAGKCAIWSNGTLHTLVLSNNANGDSTECTGISNNGKLVGENSTLDNVRSFLKIGSDLDFFEPAGSPDDHATGVNSRGDVVGYCPTCGGGYLILNPEANEGSTDREPTLTRIPISFPGATQTVPRGINYYRVIVGSYYDSAGEHGFVAVPQ